MKPKYTLDEVSLFLKRLGADQALTAAYLLNKFDGMYMSDLAQALDTGVPQVVNLCVKLERSKIIEKKTVGITGGGKMKIIKLADDAKTVLSPFFASLSEDPSINDAQELYQRLKDSKALASDKHDFIVD